MLILIITYRFSFSNEIEKKNILKVLQKNEKK